MAQEPFEKFIKNLLDQHARADQLRNISDVRSNSLLQNIDGFLLEEAFAAKFDVEGYNNDETKERVLQKLNALLKHLENNLVSKEDARHITVKICIEYVDRGYALTQDIVDYLNKIHRGY